MSRPTNSKPASGDDPPNARAPLNSRGLAGLAALSAHLPSLPKAAAEDKQAAEPAATTPLSRALRSKIVIARDSRGRGGKTVTTVRGIEAPQALLEQLARELRKELGSGVQVNEKELVVQGALSERIAASLAKRGASRIVLGN
jgi:translation initiation factor 1